MLLLLDEFDRTLEPNEDCTSKDILDFQQDLRALTTGSRQMSLVVSTHRRLIDHGKFDRPPATRSELSVRLR